MFRICALAAAAMLFTAAHALAQPACQTDGDYSTQIVDMRSHDTQKDMVLGLGLVKVLTGEAPDKAGAKPTCTRGEPIKIGRTRYTITGENTDDLPRRIVPSRRLSPTFYLAPFLDIRAVVAAEVAGEPKPEPTTLFALVRAQGADRTVVRLFSGIPSDSLLADSLQEFEDSAGPTIASLTNGHVNIFLDSVPAPTPPISPASPFRRQSGPDGEVFRTSGDGATHVGSGYVCPDELHGLQRRELAVFDAAQHGRDVGCNYGTSERDNYSFYLTYLPGDNLTRSFDAATRVALARNPRARDFEPFFSEGQPMGPTRATFWLGRNGLVEGVLMAEINGWQVSMRVTCSKDSQVAAKMIETMFKAAFEQVQPLGSLTDA